MRLLPSSVAEHLRALAALLQCLGSIPSTHIVVQHCLEQCLLLTAAGTERAGDAQAGVQANVHMYKIIVKDKK